MGWRLYAQSPKADEEILEEVTEGYNKLLYGE
jgi:hypothetical protein